jgi:TRAP-type uncharacterized transport system fused permease subunit
VYAAAGLAKTSVWDAGWESVRIAAPTYIVPFMFVYEPALLMIKGWDEWHVSLLAFASAGIGCMALAAGLHGYLLAACKMWERAVLVIAAVLLIAPEIYSSIAGIVLLFIVGSKQKFFDRAAAAAAPRATK